MGAFTLGKAIHQWQIAFASTNRLLLRDILKLLQSFKDIASVNLHNGSTCFFWNDLWHGRILSKTFSELFSFVKNPNISVQSARLTPQLHTLFHLPLSVEAFAQFHDFCSIICGLQDTPEQDDWAYIWGSSIFFPLEKDLQATHWT